MTEWLADATLSHLRDVAEWPDLGERYQVIRRLGRGGMGVVYLALDRALDREVAVKVLAGATPEPAACDRLRAEAQILGRLEHPGIVPVHDVGTLADGRVFYVMTRVRGKGLDEAVTDDTSLAERLEIFLRICDAVSFAHAQGIVHRDLKPGNVMLGPFGEVLVMDWGVAKVLTTITADDVVVGTPGFMAPEQAGGDFDRVDARADVFALGAILHHLLPTSSPKPLAAIAGRAQAANVDQRYPSVEALARDLGRFRNGEAVDAYRESLVERLVRGYRRYEVPILLVVAYMIMRVLLLLWLRL
jgi:serine/threonine-protein kinase